jgi:2-polyprenyl-3-methyl-5-hydroxy-6-metoxy-1,4-benzoquinol methylase
MQADILNLRKLDQKFDLIECAGVLHHMENPMVGWKILTERLKPGGLMMIGLYSDLARQHIVRVRQEIIQRGVNPTRSEMIAFRGNLIDSTEPHHRKLFLAPDFYSLSELRDLLFHVKEHRFTIPQLGECLEELGLAFCGFHNPHILRKFRSIYDDKNAIYDLGKWNDFERKNPDIFSGMYQFWCQKV